MLIESIPTARPEQNAPIIDKTEFKKWYLLPERHTSRIKDPKDLGDDVRGLSAIRDHRDYHGRRDCILNDHDHMAR